MRRFENRKSLSSNPQVTGSNPVGRAIGKSIKYKEVSLFVFREFGDYRGHRGRDIGDGFILCVSALERKMLRRSMLHADGVTLRPVASTRAFLGMKFPYRG